ncbi:MAG: DUF1854 domain-containing protein [Candidatus Micrarchaeales archaeon]
MARENEAIELWTDLDHNLKLDKELLKIDGTRLSVAKGEKAIISVDITNIKDSFIEQGLGVAKLVLKMRDGKELEAAYFTKEKLQNFRRLSIALNEYKAKKKIEFTPSDDDTSREHDRISTLKWFLDFAMPYRSKLLLGLALSILVAGLSLIPAYLLKILIDNVLLAQTQTPLLFEELTIVLVVAYAGSAVANIAQGYVLGNLSQKIVNDLRAKVYSQAMLLSAAKMDKITSGRIMTRLTNDAGNTQWLLAYGFPTIMVNSLTLIGIGIILFSMDWNLAIYVLFPVPFVVYALIKYRTKSHRAYHKNWRRSSDMWNSLYDTVYSHFIVKSFAKEKFENKRLDAQLGQVYDSNKGIVKLNQTYWPTIAFLTALSTVVIWWIGGHQVLVGVIQVGVITAFVAYMAQFYSPINQLSNIIPFLQQGLTSGDRIREVIESNIDIKNTKKPKRPDLNGDIEFKDVWFGYDPVIPIVESFDLKLKAGHNIAVVGRSGSGKSTISKLMLRFYDVSRGSIRINGVDIKDIDLMYLRDRIAYVPQDVALFDDTVTYNIQYGANRETKNSEIIASAKAARIHEELMQLPFSYDTNLGERGWSLSGGQRQRLSIARAVIKKPEIVILDEATSNLDATSEKEIYSAILNLTLGKTTIFVTHNINEVFHSDKALMMKKGKIIEEGKPKELFKKNGEFHKMFSKQISKWDSRIEDTSKNNSSLESYLKELVNNYGEVTITEGVRKSKVNVNIKGKAFKNLVPKLPFPVTAPWFTILYEEDVGKVMIDDYRKLREKSRDTMHAAVLLNAFRPVISRVEKIDIRGDELEWKVVVDGKKRNLTTRGRRNVMQLEDKIVLTDVHDNLYEITLKEIDTNSFKLIDETI